MKLDQIKKENQPPIRLEFPETSKPYHPTHRDVVSDGLSLIGHAFSTPANWGSRYGANFENSTFKMHPFCWCEREDCPYCEDEAPNFVFKETGATVTWYKYIGRGMEFTGDLPLNFAEACLKSHPSSPTPQQVVQSIENEAEASLREFERALEAGELDDIFETVDGQAT